MNIKFILLSLCLTLKITNIKALPPLALIYGAFGIVDTVILVKEFMDDKDDQVLQVLTDYKERAEYDSLKLSKQMKQVQTTIQKAELTILSDIKMEAINKRISMIRVLSEEFGRKVNAYKNNATYMGIYIHKFIQKYEFDDLERTMIEYLQTRIFVVKPLIQVYVDYLRGIRYDDTFLLSSTTNKYMFDFFSSMMIAVGRGHGLLESCYKLKDYFAKRSIPSDWTFVENRKKRNWEVILDIWRNTTRWTSQYNDFVSFAYLKNTVEHVYFEKALQTFLIYEEDGKKTCRGSCKDRKMQFNWEGICHGRVYNCYDIASVFDRGTIVYSRDKTRIYERYSLGNTWYGRHGMEFYDFSEPMRVGLDGFYECEHCRCICDQIHHKNAVNLFYIGKIEPKEEGFVITGVRFAKYYKTIYLEIEVGKILQLALINSTSVYWQGPPVDIDSNVIQYDFVFRAFHLDNVRVKSGFVSGLQIYQKKSSLRLRVFSKPFKNFIDGKYIDKEEMHIDDQIEDKTRHYFQDRRPRISKRPGKIATNWNIDIFFGTSNQKSDAGQTMVPFFDATNITFDVKSPLGGIGFFHHTSSVDYAGYIRPFIFSLNYSSYEFFDFESNTDFIN